MTHPVVAPRLTPPPSSSASGRSVLLPADMVDEQVRRVSLFTAVSAFMWGFGMLMDGVVFPASLGATVPAVVMLLDGIAVGHRACDPRGPALRADLAREESRLWIVADAVERIRHHRA